MTVDDAPVWWW